MAAPDLREAEGGRPPVKVQLVDDKKKRPRYPKLARLAKEIWMSGLDSQESETNLRHLVGRYVGDFSDYSFLETPKWSLSTLFVNAYFEHIRRVQSEDRGKHWRIRLEDVEVPSEWALFPMSSVSLWQSQQLNDVLLTAANQWREVTHLTDKHVRYLRALELRFAQIQNEPWDMDDRASSMEIIARFWGLEYMHDVEMAFIDLAPQPLQDVPAHFEQQLATWVEDRLKQARNAGTAKLGHHQHLAAAELRLGEQETYARKEHVATTDMCSVFAGVRTIVQARCLKELIDAMDDQVGRGSAAIFAVHMLFDIKMSLDWIANCVVVDQDHMTDASKEATVFRDQPWLLLFGGSWYVVTRDEVNFTNTATRQKNVLCAIYHWFTEQMFLCEMDQDMPGVIFEGFNTKYNLQPLYDDPQFPFARALDAK